VPHPSFGGWPRSQVGKTTEGAPGPSHLGTQDQPETRRVLANEVAPSFAGTAKGGMLDVGRRLTYAELTGIGAD
jgi:hypothetical protein